MGFGLELTFSCSGPFKRKEDVLIVYLHWKLLSNGFRCLPLDFNFPVIYHLTVNFNLS